MSDTLYNEEEFDSTLQTMLRFHEVTGALTADSRLLQVEQLLDEKGMGVEFALDFDEQAGFIASPAFFAAAVSKVATAELAPRVLVMVRGMSKISAARKTAREVEEILRESEIAFADLIETDHDGLREFIGTTLRHRNGRVWLLLVAAHLAVARTMKMSSAKAAKPKSSSSGDSLLPYLYTPPKPAPKADKEKS